MLGLALAWPRAPESSLQPLLGYVRQQRDLPRVRLTTTKGVIVLELFENEAPDTIGNFALDARNPSKTGKSPLVWQACYQAAQVVFLSRKAV